jgi:hypothetical protein
LVAKSFAGCTLYGAKRGYITDTEVIG